MSEFTGERVIPGLVDDNLLNEHLARYRFAARFCENVKVLDAGCGSGYGTAEFGGARSVTAVDVSADAVRHAKENFRRPGVTFLQASCESLPFADEAFELVTAFEVIEHLPNWQKLLTEAKRVLKPGGILLVSTPNKSYYAESRAAAGPNPFHTHEFEYEEFEQALYEVFPHLRMWTQNHAEAIVFAPVSPSGAELDAPGDASVERANFYVAACSESEISRNEVFAWMPSTANLLREREQHIAKLEGELAKKDAWLRDSITDHARLQHRHEETLEELRQRNEWALQLNQELHESRAAIVKLQGELAERLEWIRGIEAERERLTALARSLDEQLDIKTRHVQLQMAEIAEHTEHLERQLKLLDERAKQLEALRAERRLIANSKWIRLGRKLNLGPVVNESGPADQDKEG